MYKHREVVSATKQRPTTKHKSEIDEESDLRMPSDEGVVDEDGIKVIPPGSQRRVKEDGESLKTTPDDSDSDSNSDMYHQSEMTVIRSTFQTERDVLRGPSMHNINLPTN